MSQTLQDLDNAIAVLTSRANDVNIAAQGVETAASAAAARVGSLPPPIDYQSQVNAIGQVLDSLDNTNAHIAAATGIVNGILP